MEGNKIGHTNFRDEFYGFECSVFHPAKPKHFDDKVRKVFRWVPLAKVKVPAEFFQDRDFMGFHELDQCSIRIFDVGEVPGGFAHIETVALVIGKTINRKRETTFGAGSI